MKMAQIPDGVIQGLKSEVSLQRLAEAQGIVLKKHGQDYIGLCPFHDDKEPSLVITPKKNLWHCLGACQSGGSVIDWVMKGEGVSFRHAVELLQNDYMPSSLAAKPVKQATTRILDNPFDNDIEDQQLLNRVIDYYHETLKHHIEALAFLEKRGISSDAIDTFKIGVANRTLGYRLPKANRKEGAAIRGQLQKTGIYRESGHEHFSGSIVIPVVDEHSNVQEVYGRKILDTLRKGTPKHLYLPGPHKGVFNIEALKASKEIIFCESLIDALTFWCNGYRNVTTSYGIEGFTKEHLAAFKQYEVERILIAYDRDDAGNLAADKLAKQLIKAGIDCYRLQFPKGMDANEYALSVTPASKSLGVVIRSAVWLGAGKKKLITTESMNDEATKNRNEDTASLVVEPENVVNEILPASPLPEPPKADIDADVSERDITITLDDRRYRIRGMAKNLSYDVLKVNVMVSNDNGMHIDTIDLYQSRPRATFIKQASLELGINEDVIKADLGKVLLKCESLQEANIKKTQAPKPSTSELTDKEQRDALKLLKSKNLLKRIQKDFNQCGIVGETTNTLVGYLASVSRKLDNPLAVIIQSTSAAGKSSLMDAVLRFIPEEDRTQYSAMTGQSLFYMGETDLKHKVLAIVEEEGASQAAYALKLLQSEGQLTIASTSKDPESGKLVTQEYKVEGPVMIFLTTTAIEVDEELMNRCLVLTVNEDREQTKAIHELQRKKRTLAGLIQKTERETLLNVHQNAQRLLKSLAVVNPYAEHLTFLNDQTRTRRDHEKYLTLIDSIALLHQYQRDIKNINHNGKPLQYIEVTMNDIEAANTLAHDVLGRTLDELPPQTRKLLTLIDKMVIEQCQKHTLQRADYHFSRRDIRDHIGWSDNQLKVHCYRLQEMEYLLVHTGSRGKAIQYELLYDGNPVEHQRQLMGLIDIDALKQHYDNEKLGGNGQKRGPSLGQVGPKLGRCLGGENKRKDNNNKTSSELDNEFAEKPYKRGNGKDQSYTQTALVAAASK
jgi:DNA primase